jgi:hypothetical protein
MVNIIGGGTRALLRIENNNSVGSPGIIFGEGGGFTEDTQPTIKKVQGTNNLAIMCGGNVGIGTASPGYKLETSGGAIAVTGTNNYLYYAVTNSTASGAYMMFDAQTAGGSGRKYQIGTTGTGNNPGTGCFELYDATGSATRLVVNASGNVGIGITNPSNALDVSSSQASARMARFCNFKNDGGSQDVCFIHTDQSFNNAVWSGSALTVTTYPSNGTNNAGYIAKFGTSDSAGGSMDPKVVISAAYNKLGFVGIGTTNPGALLQVQGTTTITGLTTINNNGGNGGTLNLQRGGTFFNGSSDWNHVIYNNGINFDSQGAFDGLRFVGVAGFQFYCQVTGLNTGISSGTLAMSINSNRQITMPYQPCFRAYYGSGGTADFTTNTILPYNTTQVNIGSHYSTSTYKFTAPVAGRYIFGASTYVAGVGSMWDITTANLGVIARNEWRVTSASQTVNSIISTTTIVELSAADTVWVVWTSDTVRLIGATKFISFWGHLIG